MNTWIYRCGWIITAMVAMLLGNGDLNARSCISDNELEAAVGDQVRAGRFAIDASMLRNAPMCSGITIARAIQQLAGRLSPESGQTEGRAPHAAQARAPVASPHRVSEVGDRASAKPQGAAVDKAPAPDLAGLLDFTSPSGCETGPRLSNLLSDLVDYPNDVGDVPQMGKLTVPAAYRAAVGSPQQERGKDGLTIHVPLRGQWLGLPVVAVAGHYWNGGDPGGFSIAMEASIPEARTKLNRAGFNIPTSGHRTIPGGYEVTISLESTGNTVTLFCM